MYKKRVDVVHKGILRSLKKIFTNKFQAENVRFASSLESDNVKEAMEKIWNFVLEGKLWTNESDIEYQHVPTWDEVKLIIRRKQTLEAFPEAERKGAEIWITLLSLLFPSAMKRHVSWYTVRKVLYRFQDCMKKYSTQNFKRLLSWDSFAWILRHATESGDLKREILSNKTYEGCKERYLSVQQNLYEEVCQRLL